MTRSVMAHTFSEVPRIDIPRSTFNRSHGLKTAFDASWLITILVDEVYPGDSFNVKCNFFARLATPLHPILDNMYLETFFFFVPNRLVWDNWEKFCGAQDDPADSIDYTVPKIGTDTTFDATTNQLFDYFGLPYVASMDLTEVSALPFRCYNLIWADWFRDQNLQDSPSLNTADVGDTPGNYFLRKRGKRHDYFTSALPWPQKQDAAVMLPLGTQAPVVTTSEDAMSGTQSALELRFAGGGAFVTADRTLGTKNAGQVGPDASAKTFSGGPIYPGNLWADLTTATAATINDLRIAFQTQRLLERDARSGTRYNETILAHFGVTVPDFRVQRPEFLGGGSTPINVTPVANTSASTAGAETKNQGDLAGFGTVGGVHSFTKSFVEHGHVIGLVNVRADITYSQGMRKIWTRDTRYDYFYPVLSQLGEQVVENSEIYYQNTSADHDAFGYQERYAELRYFPSLITSIMRPENPASLESWHLSEEFTSLPALGDTFIQDNTLTMIDRAIAVSTEPQFIADFFFDMQCARPMPLYGVPGNLDHL